MDDNSKKTNDKTADSFRFPKANTHQREIKKREEGKKEKMIKKERKRGGNGLKYLSFHIQFEDL